MAVFQGAFEGFHLFTLHDQREAEADHRRPELGNIQRVGDYHLNMQSSHAKVPIMQESSSTSPPPPHTLYPPPLSDPSAMLRPMDNQALLMQRMHAQAYQHYGQYLTQAHINPYALPYNIHDPRILMVPPPVQPIPSETLPQPRLKRTKSEDSEDDRSSEEEMNNNNRNQASNHFPATLSPILPDQRSATKVLFSSPPFGPVPSMHHMMEGWNSAGAGPDPFNRLLPPNGPPTPSAVPPIWSFSPWGLPGYYNEAYMRQAVAGANLAGIAPMMQMAGAPQSPMGFPAHQPLPSFPSPYTEQRSHNRNERNYNANHNSVEQPTEEKKAAVVPPPMSYPGYEGYYPRPAANNAAPTPAATPAPTNPLPTGAAAPSAAPGITPATNRFVLKDQPNAYQRKSYLTPNPLIICTREACGDRSNTSLPKIADGTVQVELVDGMGRKLDPNRKIFEPADGQFEVPLNLKCIAEFSLKVLQNSGPDLFCLLFTVNYTTVGGERYTETIQSRKFVVQSNKALKQKEKPSVIGLKPAQGGTDQEIDVWIKGSEFHRQGILVCFGDRVGKVIEISENLLVVSVPARPEFREKVEVPVTVSNKYRNEVKTADNKRLVYTYVPTAI
ncbi:hypothetical protein PROFUN_13812 [Planoprotostelium fungivorum]|uniref:IPT/TIG domain-containing protein n=1 Tax=Planoprotostelium fungivorum TaxID=1890364 RepID=A0A2P6N2X1_9EUKA|nr:hypothetical protein PROFUN_13812 [Planoprotostelium fungivorum]